jgi:hypothetical protein
MSKENINREDAARSLAAFVAAIKRLDLRSYDLVFGAGDSGQIMAWITRTIYEELGIAEPPFIVMPIYRHADEAETILFDNNIFSEELKSAVSRNPVNEVLFVDDEIGGGSAAAASIKLIEACLGKDKRHYTIVAEDGGFDVRAVFTGLDVDFVPTKKREEGVFNAVAYLPDLELREEIEALLGDKVECYTAKTAMLTLLDLPIKEFNDGRPAFTYRYRDMVGREVEDFERKQNDFQRQLRELINRICL